MASYSSILRKTTPPRSLSLNRKDDGQQSGILIEKIYCDRTKGRKSSNIRLVDSSAVDQNKNTEKLSKVNSKSDTNLTEPNHHCTENDNWQNNSGRASPKLIRTMETTQAYYSDWTGSYLLHTQKQTQSFVNDLEEFPSLGTSRPRKRTTSDTGSKGSYNEGFYNSTQLSPYAKPFVFKGAFQGTTTLYNTIDNYNYQNNYQDYEVDDDDQYYDRSETYSPKAITNEEHNRNGQIEIENCKSDLDYVSSSLSRQKYDTQLSANAKPFELNKRDYDDESKANVINKKSPVVCDETIDSSKKSLPTNPQSFVPRKYNPNDFRTAINFSFNATRKVDDDHEKNKEKHFRDKDNHSQYQFCESPKRTITKNNVYENCSPTNSTTKAPVESWRRSSSDHIVDSPKRLEPLWLRKDEDTQNAANCSVTNKKTSGNRSYLSVEAKPFQFKNPVCDGQLYTSNEKQKTSTYSIEKPNPVQLRPNAKPFMFPSSNVETEMDSSEPSNLSLNYKWPLLNGSTQRSNRNGNGDVNTTWRRGALSTLVLTSDKEAEDHKKYYNPNSSHRNCSQALHEYKTQSKTDNNKTMSILSPEAFPFAPQNIEKENILQKISNTPSESIKWERPWSNGEESIHNYFQHEQNNKNRFNSVSHTIPTRLKNSFKKSYNRKDNSDADLLAILKENLEKKEALDRENEKKIKSENVKSDCKKLINRIPHHFSLENWDNSLNRKNEKLPNEQTNVQKSTTIESNNLKQSVSVLRNSPERCLSSVSRDRSSYAIPRYPSQGCYFTNKCENNTRSIHSFDDHDTGSARNIQMNSSSSQNHQQPTDERLLYSRRGPLTNNLTTQLTNVSPIRAYEYRTNEMQTNEIATAKQSSGSRFGFKKGNEDRLKIPQLRKSDEEIDEFYRNLLEENTGCDGTISSYENQIDNSLTFQTNKEINVETQRQSKNDVYGRRQNALPASAAEIASNLVNKKYMSLDGLSGNLYGSDQNISNVPTESTTRSTKTSSNSPLLFQRREHIGSTQARSAMMNAFAVANKNSSDHQTDHSHAFQKNQEINCKTQRQSESNDCGNIQNVSPAKSFPITSKIVNKYSQISMADGSFENVYDELKDRECKFVSTQPTTTSMRTNSNSPLPFHRRAHIDSRQTASATNNAVHMEPQLITKRLPTSTQKATNATPPPVPPRRNLNSNNILNCSSKPALSNIETPPDTPAQYYSNYPDSGKLNNRPYNVDTSCLTNGISKMKLAQDCDNNSYPTTIPKLPLRPSTCGAVLKTELPNNNPFLESILAANKSKISKSSHGQSEKLTLCQYTEVKWSITPLSKRNNNNPFLDDDDYEDIKSHDEPAYVESQLVIAPPKDPLWYYIDPQTKEQGPFTSVEMAEWLHIGYFSDKLNIRRNCDKRFVSIEEFSKLTASSLPFLDSAVVPPLDVEIEIKKSFTNPFLESSMNDVS